jgi:hypothetical protein
MSLEEVIRFVLLLIMLYNFDIRTCHCEQDVPYNLCTIIEDPTTEGDYTQWMKTI